MPRTDEPGAARTSAKAKPAKSLRARALRLLAQREQSREELRRKLLRYARDATSEERDREAADSVEDCGHGAMKFGVVDAGVHFGIDAGVNVGVDVDTLKADASWVEAATASAFVVPASRHPQANARVAWAGTGDVDALDVLSARASEREPATGSAPQGETVDRRTVGPSPTDLAADPVPPPRANGSITGATVAKPRFDGSTVTAAIRRGRDESDPVARVDAVMQWLEAHRFLSDERFVESRVNARAGRFGNLRIRQELGQHGLALPPEAEAALRDSELDRAGVVRSKKFGDGPFDSSARARQARFLAARGFSSDTIRRVMRGLADVVPDESSSRRGASWGRRPPSPDDEPNLP